MLASGGCGAARKRPTEALPTRADEPAQSGNDDYFQEGPPICNSIDDIVAQASDMNFRRGEASG